MSLEHGRVPRGSVSDDRPRPRRYPAMSLRIIASIAGGEIEDPVPHAIERRQIERDIAHFGFRQVQEGSFRP